MSDVEKFGVNKGVWKAIEATRRIADLQHQVDRMSEIKMPDIRNYQLADYQYEVLVRTIKAFENDLDDNHEVAVQLASFGQTLIMQVSAIGYSNPAVIHFHGFVNGQRAELVQHVSQLNFLLMAVPKADPEKPPMRIGFEPPLEEGSD